MARRKICTKCGQEFTEAKYNIHKFTHLRDQVLRKGPADVPTSRLLPVDVPEDDIIMEEDASQGSTQPVDYSHSPFADHHETTDTSLQHNNPFSDDYAMDNDLPLHGTPSSDPPDPLPPSTSNNEDMDISPSPEHSEDDLEQQPASVQLSLDGEDIGFEDSGLDPGSTGLPSLSEQLKERFLREYHGGGELY